MLIIVKYMQLTLMVRRDRIVKTSHGYGNVFFVFNEQLKSNLLS